MAQVTTGRIYECEGHSQKGHELAGGHPVIVVGKQSLIDNQGIAIVVPLTSTRPNHPVHWAVRLRIPTRTPTFATSSRFTSRKSEASSALLTPRKSPRSRTDWREISITTTKSALQPWGGKCAQAVYGPRPYRTPAD